MFRMIRPAFAALTFSLAAVLSASAQPPTSARTPIDAVPVTLTQPVPGMYKLANGIVSVTIDGPFATIPSIQYKGEEMISQYGRHNRIYWSMDGGTSYQIPNHCICAVKTNNAEMVDVGCKHSYEARDPHAVDIDIHYVLRRGASGVYAYAILTHPASYPSTSIGEWRMVWPTNAKDGDHLLEKIYVDDKRHWLMPTMADQDQAQTMSIKEISLFKTGDWAGKMESKYSYSANYESIGAFGYASDKRQLGAWTVMGNYEYYNDGPLKQDLTALSGAMTHHFGRNHYNGTGIGIAAGEQWSKIFGPFLLYFNSGAPGDELWHDARAQAAREHEQWPYAWLTGVPEYPSAAERGAVTGKLHIADRLKPSQSAAGAWVGLTQPPPGLDFQSESKNYQYWVKASADGSFTIPNVRPGSYTLYAFADGEVGQFSAQNVQVTAAHTNPLGEITWKIPRTGDYLAWEIGKPDRNSTEFRHGDDFFTPYLYKTFSRDFANPLVYTVGKSDYRKDWNYAQSVYVTPDGRQEPWLWTIHFMLDHLPAKGEGALIVALAGSNQTRLQIDLNGQTLQHYEPPLDGGNGLLRQSSYSKYSTLTIPIAMSQLHQGDNTIDLRQTDTHREFSVVFYDYLALEMPK
jgi:rhamnogalacturonan endolyase